MFLDLNKSLELYYLGYKRKCYGYWEHYLSDEKAKFFLKMMSVEDLKRIITLPETSITPSPTYSEVFDWLREEYDTDAWISPLLGSGEYHYYIRNKKKPYSIIKSDNSKKYNIIREELLDKVIEILKAELEREKNEDL